MPPRPSKKQKALLDFIGAFIAEYGYSPSYREIKAGLSYGSIGTVAKHIDNLVTKGLLAKRRQSARSLEPIEPISQIPKQLRPVASSGEKWLIDAVDARFRMVEATARRSQADLDHLAVLVTALKLLGLDAAASAFRPRLSAIASALSAKQK